MIWIWTWNGERCQRSVLCVQGWACGLCGECSVLVFSSLLWCECVTYHTHQEKCSVWHGPFRQSIRWLCYAVGAFGRQGLDSLVPKHFCLFYVTVHMTVSSSSDFSSQAKTVLSQHKCVTQISAFFPNSFQSCREVYVSAAIVLTMSLTLLRDFKKYYVLSGIQTCHVEKHLVCYGPHMIPGFRYQSARSLRMLTCWWHYSIDQVNSLKAWKNSFNSHGTLAISLDIFCLLVNLLRWWHRKQVS